jgi:hypothetical protein
LFAVSVPVGDAAPAPAQIGSSKVRFYKKPSLPASLTKSLATKVDKAGPVVVLKCNSAVVYQAGVARRGADRTRAQREAAARNLLHQAAPAAAADGEPAPVATSPRRTGYLGKAARAKIKTGVDSMIFLSHLPAAKRQTLNEMLGYRQQACYLTLATFTLPSAQRLDAAGNFDDRAVKREVWAPMVQELRNRFGVALYLWVAEPQENGNIHFHALIDKYIDNTADGGRQLTRTWNRLLDNAGYIAPYTAKMKALHQKGFVFDGSMTELAKLPKNGSYVREVRAVSYETQVERWLQGESCSWTQPNSVDVHKLGHANSIKAYICKYLTKNTGAEVDGVRPRPIAGAVWGRADELAQVQAYSEPFTDELVTAFCDLQDSGNNALKVRLLTDEGTFTPQEFADNDLAGQVTVRATVYTYSQTAFWKVAPPAFKRRFENHYRIAFQRIYGGNAQPLPPVEQEQEIPILRVDDVNATVQAKVDWVFAMQAQSDHEFSTVQI